MARVFDNPNGLVLKVIQSRFFAPDPDAVVSISSSPATPLSPAINYVLVDSILSDETITSLLATATTAAEQANLDEFRSDRISFRAEYQTTIDNLTAIENNTTPTNQQIQTAIKYLAKTLRLLLRLLVKTRFAD